MINIVISKLVQNLQLASKFLFLNYNMSLKYNEELKSALRDIVNNSFKLLSEFGNTSLNKTLLY